MDCFVLHDVCKIIVIACLRLGASVAPGQDGVQIKTCLELSKTLYKVITIDRTLYKWFKIFKQKCELIFDGPLDETSEDKKTRLLLLWAGDKGLEIYNTATWALEEDSLN